MNLILLDEDLTTGEIRQSINLGTFTEAEYFADMADLMTAKEDWDILCNWLLSVVIDEGILTANGLTDPGYTLRSFARLGQDYISSVQKSKDPEVKGGKVYQFLGGMYGTMIKGMLRIANAVGDPGENIVVSEEAFKRTTAMISDILLRQLWRDPERQRLLQPIDSYFINPGNPLDA